MQAAATLIGVAAGVVSARLALSTTWYAFGDTSSRSALLGLAAGTALLASRAQLCSGSDLSGGLGRSSLPRGWPGS